jgi:hypothetical protein
MMLLDGLVSCEVGEFSNHVEPLATLLGRAILKREMPYRIDLRHSGPDAFDRLVELGALDVEQSDKGGIAAVMPDRVTPDQVLCARS